MRQIAKSIAPPLPRNLEAERWILGAVILDNAALGRVCEHIEAADFFLPQNALIFRVMCEVAKSGQPIDAVMLLNWLTEHGKLEDAGGDSYLAQLGDGVPRVTNVAHYAGIVKTKAQARRLILQHQADIDLLLSANGNLAEAINEVVIHSAHIREEFGQKESATLFRTAADLVEESERADFVVEPYIARGALTELTAKIKAGKTTYLLGEIVRRALAKGPVVYLTEQPPASFRVALERAGLLGRESLHVLPFTAVIGKSWDEITRIASAKCKEVGAVLLVVDTLSHFCGLDGDSENDSGAAIAAMKPLQEIAASGTAVVDSRHERKSGGEIGDSGRGSSAFGGAADTLLTLRRTEGRTKSTLRKIECISRFDGLPPEAIYQYEDGEYRYVGTENEISEREAEGVILSAVLDSEENAKPLDELIAGSDPEVARTTAQRVTKRLVKSGKLQQIGKGKKGNPFRYFLPEKDSAQTTHIHGQKESEGSRLPLSGSPQS